MKTIYQVSDCQDDIDTKNNSHINKRTFKNIIHVIGMISVDWETVGRCVNRALHDLEPERSRRLDGLVNIGIDKISYKKGHK